MIYMAGIVYPQGIRVWSYNLELSFQQQIQYLVTTTGVRVPIA